MEYKTPTIVKEVLENERKALAVRKALSNAMKAHCFTQDYVGSHTLPAIEGWAWYDSAVEISKLIPDDTWTHEFWLRVTDFKKGRMPDE